MRGEGRKKEKEEIQKKQRKKGKGEKREKNIPSATFVNSHVASYFMQEVHDDGEGGVVLGW